MREEGSLGRPITRQMAPLEAVAAGGYARAPMRQLEEGERDESEDAPRDKRLEIKVHEVELAIELSRSRVRVRRVRQRVLNVQRGLDDWIEVRDRIERRAELLVG